MPYFISDSNPDCSGWAVEKEDGEVIGCHTSKQDAIDQMVAVSIAEDMEPGGERARPDELLVDDYVSWTEGEETKYGELKMVFGPGMVQLPGMAGEVESTEDDPVALIQIYQQGEEGFEEQEMFVAVKFSELTRIPELEEEEEEASYDEDDDMPDEDDVDSRADAPAPAKDQITGSEENEPGSAAGKGGDIELNEATETALGNKTEQHNQDMADRNRPEWTRVRLGALRSVYRRGAGAYSTSHRPGISRGAWAMARVNAFLFLARTGRPENAAYVGDNDLLHPDHPRYSESNSIEDRELPENYRPAVTADVPANHNCGNCGYFKNFWCKRWDAEVSPAYYCNAWEPVEGLPNDNPGQMVQTGDVNDEDPQYQPYTNTYDRQLSFDVPVYIRDAARKGLDYYGQGLGGDGLVARTIREAREMAAGRISEDKVIRANAWGARHLVDLEAPQNSDADNDGFPGNGAVAFYLWGINPLDPSPAMQWFERQAERVREEEGRLGYLLTLARLSKLFVDK